MNAVVRQFQPDVRLKRLLAAPGGIRAEDALTRARAKLDEIKDSCLAGVDSKIERISEIAASGSADALEGCYALSNEIFAESGAFGLSELSAAAHSLCSLLSVPDRTKVPAAALKVYVDAMRALRSPQVVNSAPLRQAVLSELQILVQRFAAASAT